MPSFLLYPELNRSELFRDLEILQQISKSGEEPAEYDRSPEPNPEKLTLRITSFLIDQAMRYGFEGNLLHCYLAHTLVSTETPYTLLKERRSVEAGSMDGVMMRDLKIFRTFFSLNLETLSLQKGLEDLGLVTAFVRSSEGTFEYGEDVRSRICNLGVALAVAMSELQMKELLDAFYENVGVGEFGLHRAFRVSESRKHLITPLMGLPNVRLSDLVGLETAKEKLRANTESFLEGLGANNCLLYGDAGTGKSTSVKAIANEYYDRGLRVVEIYKHQFSNLHRVLRALGKRNYHFIVFMDDLSFEGFETEYKFLKAVIEGGLEQIPENVLIYATSNRRHLIREDASDRDEDMLPGDTVEEKLSLAHRFGEQIYFGRPGKQEFEEIVQELAARSNIELDGPELFRLANSWEIRHGGRSGRSAEQFILWLRAREGGT